MSVTPTGRVSLPLFNVRRILGDSTAFQSMMSVASAALAVAKVYYIETDEVVDGAESEEAERPRCVLSYGFGNFRARSTSTTGYKLTGPVIAEIEIPVPVEYTNDWQNGILWWGNLLGELLQDLMTLGCKGNGQGYINLNEIALLSWGRSDPNENNGVIFFGALLELTWEGI